MAGTVVVDNITTGTGATVPAATVVSGTAKAWVNFNGTGTVAIRASFNVSGITDNGTGDYTVNFTNAMPGADYAVVGMPDTNSGLSGMDMWIHGAANGGTNPTSSGVRVRVGQSGASNYDVLYNNVAIFR